MFSLLHTSYFLFSSIEIMQNSSANLLEVCDISINILRLPFFLSIISMPILNPYIELRDPTKSCILAFFYRLHG